MAFLLVINRKKSAVRIISKNIIRQRSFLHFPDSNTGLLPLSTGKHLFPNLLFTVRHRLQCHGQQLFKRPAQLFRSPLDNLPGAACREALALVLCPFHSVLSDILSFILYLYPYIFNRYYMFHFHSPLFLKCSMQKAFEIFIFLCYNNPTAGKTCIE